MLGFDKNVLFFFLYSIFSIIDHYRACVLHCLQATRYFLLLVPQSVESVPFRRLSLL